jgi:hypothetical protein
MVVVPLEAVWIVLHCLGWINNVDDILLFGANESSPGAARLSLVAEIDPLVPVLLVTLPAKVAR